ncbi:MAG: aminopeptidase P family protein [Planctomycetota bacterium]|nr:MAG: aminopeptidase P family protein [Planctomycetota bacterium]
MLLAAPLLSAFLVPLTAPGQGPEDGRGQGLFDAAWHAGRRRALLERVEDGVLVLRGAPAPSDSRPFRQDNDFWYFTGLSTPDAVLVLDATDGREVLLVPPADPSAERWLGDLIDPEEARAATGIEDCRPLAAGRRPWGGLEDLLAELAAGRPVFRTPLQPAENWMTSRDDALAAARARQLDPFDGRPSREDRFRRLLEERYGVQVEDLSPVIDALRLIKTEPEIEAIRRAAEISGRAHEAAIRLAEPGLPEWRLAAEMTGAMLAAGARGPAYAAIVGSGPNACVLHYSANRRALAAGDLVLIDYGAEFNHYCADVSRTWPVDGRFDPRQREVYEAVLAAQEAAFAECKPGGNLRRVQQAAVRVLRERGFPGQPPHGIGHWLGMATHDVGGWAAEFRPGMVFTVEPGVYLPEEGIGVRIEDDVLITEDGCEILTEGIPRRIEDLERLRR